MKPRLLAIVAGLIALAAYSVFLLRNVSFAVGGPDTSGYFNEAQMIASGRTSLPIELVRTLKLDDSWLNIFTPLGFIPAPRATMRPTYPAGLPIHLAVIGSIGGWNRAPFFLVPLAALASLVLLFGVGRGLDLPLPLAFAAPLIVALFPPFLWHAVQPASDVLAMFWTLVAMSCALHPRMALMAGAAFAIGVWVRPTNALLGLALIVAMRLQLRSLLRAAAGALPIAIALMWWNATEYGSAFRTGYGNVIGDLSWEGAAEAGSQYVRFLTEMLTPIAFPIGLLVLFDKRAGSWTRWMLIAWFVPFFVFYCFYGFFDGWWCLRFLLPAIPALILGALILIRDLHAALERLHRAAAHLVAAGLVAWMCIAPLQFARSINLFEVLPNIEAGYPRYIAWAEQRVPRRSIVVTGVLSGAFLYYSHRSIARYDQLNDEKFQQLRAYAASAGLPWYVVVADFEMDHAALEKQLRGKWTAIDHLDNISIYRLDS